MLELINSYLMAAHQMQSPFISDKERKDLLKSNLKKLESLQQKIEWEIMETNNKLRYENLQTNKALAEEY